MDFKKISQVRLSSQQISNPEFKTPQDLLSWMGAMQAQDFKMAKLAIAARLGNPNRELIDSAIDKGEIIRTHILRPTWHFVAADDIYWMLELTAPRLMANLNSRHKELKISEDLLKKSNRLIVKSLGKDANQTREEIYEVFKKAKIDYSKNRGSHLLMWAEFNSLICSGASKNGKPSYALLEERVPTKNLISEAEALYKLAKTYFLSHAPATLKDFAWWSGLTMKRAKLGLASIESELESINVDGEIFWFTERHATVHPKVKLLPAYDEFQIAYKDKTRSMPFLDHRKKVQQVGVFWPFIVVDGLISGVWKLVSKKDQLIFNYEIFRALTKAEETALRKEVKKLSNYLNQKISFQ